MVCELYVWKQDVKSLKSRMSSVDQLLCTINHQVFWCDNLRKRSFTDSLLVGGGRTRRGATPATLDDMSEAFMVSVEELSFPP